MYRIKDWATKFENSETRKYKHLQWVPVPNKLDGDGIATLLDHPDGMAHFGVWVSLLEIASKDSVCRGDLSRSSANGRVGHNSITLARILRTNEKLICVAIGRLLQLGWLQEVTICSESISGNLPESPEKFGEMAAELNRIELNRIEEKKTELIESNLDKPSESIQIDPIDSWKMERLEPWATKLKPICSTLGPKTWQLFKSLVDKYGIEMVSKVAWNNLGQWKWPDDLAAILATCKAAEVIPEDPDASRAIIVLKSKGWQQAIDYVGLPGVSSEQEAIAECRANPGLVAELLEWANAN